MAEIEPREEILFVGGPWDGRWEPVEMSDYHRPEHAFYKVAVRGANSRLNADVQEHTYELRELTCGNRIHWIYFHSSAPTDATIATLMEGYKPSTWRANERVP